MLKLQPKFSRKKIDLIIVLLIQATIGCSLSDVKDVLVRGERLQLVLWDTAGTERYRTPAIVPMYYRRRVARVASNVPLISQ